MPRLRILYPNHQMNRPACVFSDQSFYLERTSLCSRQGNRTPMPRLRILYPNHQMNRPTWFFKMFFERGSWGIRTPGTGTRTAVQQTAGFSHSPKLPRFPLKVSEKHSRSNAGAKVRNKSDSHKFFCNNFQFSFNCRLRWRCIPNINRWFQGLSLRIFAPFHFLLAHCKLLPGRWVTPCSWSLPVPLRWPTAH